MTESYSDERRTYLKAALAAGGATLCLPLLNTGDKPAPPSISTEKPRQGEGYRQTEHISTYYRTAAQ